MGREFATKVTKLVFTDFRDRPEGHSVAAPVDEVVAALRFGGWLFRSSFGPDKKINEMLTPLVNERGDGAATNVFDAATDEREALRRQVFDGRGEVELAFEPGANGVLI